MAVKESPSVVINGVYRWADDEWAQVISVDRDVNRLKLRDPRANDEWTLPLRAFEEGIADGSIERVRLTVEPMEGDQ